MFIATFSGGKSLTELPNKDRKSDKEVNFFSVLFFQFISRFQLRKGDRRLCITNSSVRDFSRNRFFVVMPTGLLSENKSALKFEICIKY